jgi:hypothetical protein
LKSHYRRRSLWLRIAAEVSVFGKAASENGSEVPFFVVLRSVALISRELVTFEWGVGSGERVFPHYPLFQMSLRVATATSRSDESTPHSNEFIRYVT